MMDRNLQIAPHVAWQVVGGETVIVDLRNGFALGLNETGGMIWREIGSSNRNSIAGHVATAFDLETEAARADVDEFVGELLERELIMETDD